MDYGVITHDRRDRFRHVAEGEPSGTAAFTGAERKAAMSATSQFVAGAKNPFASAFGIGSLVLILLFAVSLHVLGVSLAIFVPLLGAAALLWIVVRHPLGGLGAFLAFMPIFPLAFMLGEFFGPPHVALASGFSRVVLLMLICALWHRNGLKLTVPDWFLLISFALGIVRLAFGGTLIGLLTDFNFMIAYAAGRVTCLTTKQETRWARRAVWIVAVLSVLGMTEIFVFGEGPRTVLYMSVLNDVTQGGELDATFRADQFSGIREAATMPGPGGFASLCMVALIAWWVYCRNLWPAGMIAAGLVCTVTRSAWLGTALAIPLIAIIMDQRKRLLLYATLVLVLFAASVPILGLGDYLFSTRTGQDYSVQGHQESILTGWVYVAGHPLGSGPGNVDAPYATSNSTRNAPFIENTYLRFASEYGILTSLCFLGFVFGTLRVTWRERTRLGYVALGILVGFSMVMALAPQILVFPLACWIWFPVGLAVRSSLTLQDSGAGGSYDISAG